MGWGGIRTKRDKVEKARRYNKTEEVRTPLHPLPRSGANILLEVGVGCRISIRRVAWTGEPRATLEVGGRSA